METNQQDSDLLNEGQTIKVIRDMIEISRNKMNNDGILFILWGWIFFVCAIVRLLLRTLIITQEIASYTNNALLVLIIIGIIYSINNIYSNWLKVNTYSGQILRYLWGAIIFLNLYILIFQIKAHQNIDWLLSQYMLMLALGTFVTGGILRFRPLIYSSISFIVLAQIGLFFHSNISILFAAVSFVTGLIVPGHILYSKRKR